MVVSTQRVATWWGAGRSACRCTAWALRLLRDRHQCHMTLAGGFRCHGDISFFLHQGWLVIWVKVILLPPSFPHSVLLPDWAVRRHQIKWQLTHSRTHHQQTNSLLAQSCRAAISSFCSGCEGIHSYAFSVSTVWFMIKSFLKNYCFIVLPFVQN